MDHSEMEWGVGWIDLSSCRLSENVKDRICKTVILLVVLYDCETYLLTSYTFIPVLMQLYLQLFLYLTIEV
jgi:hypothetical protein